MLRQTVLYSAHCMPLLSFKPCTSYREIEEALGTEELVVAEEELVGQVEYAGMPAKEADSNYLED